MLAPAKEQATHGKVDELEVCRNTPDVQQGIGAVLLDIGQTNSQVGNGDLKLTNDGHTVLAPQPSDDPNDPLNWSETKKNLILFTITLASFQADFQVAVGVPALIPQAAEWGLSQVHVNYAGNLNLLMNGIVGLLLIPFISFWGRAPVLFWIVFVGTFMCLGTALVQDFTSYYTLRAFMGLFLSGPSSISLAFIRDVFFLHQRARKIGIWFAVFLTSPYFGPMFGYYIIAATGSWRACYWMNFGLDCLVLVCIVLFLDETFYRRDIPRAEQPDRGSRILRLLGIWQIRVHHGYFTPLRNSFFQLFKILLKPVIFPLLIYYLLSVMWAVGINQSSSILFSLPKSEGGYGMGLNAIGYLTFSPIIAVAIGETLGHWGNDWVANRFVRRHKGVFKPEARLPTTYFTLLLTVPGLILVGQALQHHLSWVVVAFGWGMYVAGVMIASVPVMAYALDSYPNAPGEVSAWINFARVIGGFSVGYFQEQWGLKAGFDVSFGIQAAIVGAAALIILGLQIGGEKLRVMGGTLES